jgi:hypothetical protein
MMGGAGMMPNMMGMGGPYMTSNMPGMMGTHPINSFATNAASMGGMSLNPMTLGNQGFSNPT